MLDEIKTEKALQDKIKNLQDELYYIEAENKYLEKQIEEIKALDKWAEESEWLPTSGSLTKILTTGIGLV